MGKEFEPPSFNSALLLQVVSLSSASQHNSPGHVDQVIGEHDFAPSMARKRSGAVSVCPRIGGSMTSCVFSSLGVCFKALQANREFF